VVILVINDGDISVLKLKGDTPIAAHPDGPEILSAPLQGVEHKARDIHIIDAGGGVERRQL